MAARKDIGPGWAFGRLCSECLETLRGQPPARTPVAPTTKRLTLRSTELLHH